MTNLGCDARTGIVCGVKAVKERQTRMRMLIEAVKVGVRGREAVKATVEFRATELDGESHHFEVESVVYSTQ